MKIFKNTLFPAVFAVLVAPMSHAATVSISTQDLHAAGTNEPADVSVFSGNSYIDTAFVTRINLAPVLDYAFFSASTTALIQGAGSVVPGSVSNSGTSGTASRGTISYYTTTDPGAMYPSAETANASGQQLTVGHNNTLTGTIDFSTLTNTTDNIIIYLLHGGFVNFTNLAFTEDGGATTNEAMSNTPRNLLRLSTVTISNFDTTDSFTYAFSGSFNNPTFAGVIVTQAAAVAAAVPEPTSGLLAACSGFALLMVRRRN